MELVHALKQFNCEEYKLIVVKPSNHIDFDGKYRFYCLDCNSLAKQWNITMKQLEFLMSLGVQFKEARYYHESEVEKGIDKVGLINSDVLKELLIKLQHSGFNDELNIRRENAVIQIMIDTVGGEKKWLD